MKQLAVWFISLALLATACGKAPSGEDDKASTEKNASTETSKMEDKVNEFATFTLQADLSHLSENQKQLVAKMIEIGHLMDDIFWQQAYGDKEALMAKAESEAMKKFIAINYGPWERLNGNEPFMDGVGPKPAGARFYPADMTDEEFQAWENEAKSSLYTMIRRDENGDLQAIPYHEYFKEPTQKAAELLKEAAQLAENEAFKNYLNLRAEALLTDQYRESDMAWMDVKNNALDFVVGPIENYEDSRYGTKTAHEAFVLIKDQEWSQKLDHFATLLPELQKALPVDEKYKQETPGSDSDLGAYEVVYYAGDCNAGSKTIAINLPNDETVQKEKGSRKLQLKNAMQAKFDKILVPISELVIDESQRKHVTFQAFFENTMFHEVAHGLGVKNTITGKGTAREALGKYYSAVEEGKADILGLFLVTQLNEMGELPDNDLMDNYVTFMASIFRSVRFGVASSHGKANMMRFNYFLQKDAFTRDETTGTYRVNFDKMQEAMNSLSEKILVMQGEGDKAAAEKMVTTQGVIPAVLEKDLKRIDDAGIPRDIRFKQGKKVLNL